MMSFLSPCFVPDDLHMVCFFHFLITLWVGIVYYCLSLPIEKAWTVSC